MKLIDANEVKDLLLGLDSLPWEEQVDELVDAMPTAYDVEAVVRELEEKGCELVCGDGYGWEGRLEDMIRIVRQGGRE